MTRFSAHEKRHTSPFIERVRLVHSWILQWSLAERLDFAKFVIDMCYQDPGPHISKKVTSSPARYNYPMLAAQQKMMKVKNLDFIAFLPRPIVAQILSYLDPVTLCRCAQVSWRWKTFTEANAVWKDRCHRYRWYLKPPARETDRAVYKTLFVQNVLRYGYPKEPLLRSPSPFRRKAWKDASGNPRDLDTVNRPGSPPQRGRDFKARPVPKVVLTKTHPASPSHRPHSAPSARHAIPNTERPSFPGRSRVDSANTSGLLDAENTVEKDLARKTEMNFLTSTMFRRMTYKPTTPTPQVKKGAIVAEVDIDQDRSLRKASGDPSTRRSVTTTTVAVTTPRPPTHVRTRPGEKKNASGKTAPVPTQVEEDWLPDDAYPRLLLVSSAVPAHAVLTDAARAEVIVVLYDHESSTIDVISARMSRALKGRRARSIGIVVPGGPGFMEMSDDARIDRLSLAKRPSLRRFLKSINSCLVPSGRVDLLVPGLATTNEGHKFVAELEVEGKLRCDALDDLAGDIVSTLGRTDHSGAIAQAGLYFDRRRLEAWRHVAGEVADAAAEVRTALAEQLGDRQSEMFQRMAGRIAADALAGGSDGATAVSEAIPLIREAITMVARRAPEHPAKFLAKHFAGKVSAGSDSDGSDSDDDFSDSSSESEDSSSEEDDASVASYEDDNEVAVGRSMRETIAKEKLKKKEEKKKRREERRKRREEKKAERSKKNKKSAGGKKNGDDDNESIASYEDDNEVVGGAAKSGTKKGAAKKSPTKTKGGKHADASSSEDEATKKKIAAKELRDKVRQKDSAREIMRERVKEKIRAAVAGARRVRSPSPPRGPTLGDRALSASQRRELIAKDILRAEVDFASTLRAIHDIFAMPLRSTLGSKPIATAPNIRMMFSDIEAVQSVADRLLNELSVRLTTPWGPEAAVADVFCGIVPYLRIFHGYIANISTAARVVRKCEAQSPMFRAFLRQAKERAECRGMSLTEMLMAPLDRIGGYVRQLCDLRHVTPERHPDSMSLDAAIEGFGMLKKFVDETTTSAAAQIRLVELQSAIAECPKIVTPSRKFLFVRSFTEVVPNAVPLVAAEGSGAKADPTRALEYVCVQDVALYVFTDLLILTFRTGGRQPFVPGFKFVDRYLTEVNLADVRITELGDHRGIRHLFGLSHKQQTWFLQSPTAAEKEDFIGMLQLAIKKAPSKAESLNVNVNGNASAHSPTKTPTKKQAGVTTK